jgi:hypothetical protein
MNLSKKQADYVVDIANRNGGTIHPDEVVEAARSEESPIHRCFVWDDTKAASLYRHRQAQEIIRLVVITLVSNGNDCETRSMVSLSSGRVKGGGQYRMITTVMEDADMKAQLLSDALSELEAFRRKYAILSELAGVFELVDKLASASRC